MNGALAPFVASREGLKPFCAITADPMLSVALHACYLSASRRTPSTASSLGPRWTSGAVLVAIDTTAGSCFVICADIRLVMCPSLASKCPPAKLPPSRSPNVSFRTGNSDRPPSKGNAMWIVKLALHRPYTFIVLAVLLFILGPLAIMRTPTDIFPNIDIPVVSIVWSYSGFSAEDMAHRITSNYERALTSDVDDIEHIESQSLNGVSVVKIFFHPGADINRAIAEAAVELRIDSARAAARHAAAQHHHVQRVDRADPATRRSPAIRCPNSRSTTSATASFARSSRRCRARPCRCRSAARCARSWSNIDPQRAAGQRAWRRSTWSTRSTRRT